MGHKAVTIQRFFKNTFSENPMQLSIDIVLGKFVNKGYMKEQQAYINRQISYIASLQPKIETITIAVASWNLAGVKAYEDVDLKSWLLAHENPDIMVIGFQEIVQLNARGLMSIDKQVLKQQISAVLANLDKAAP